MVIIATFLLPLFSCEHTDGRPNVVLILVDDMGWSDLGCYGGEINTPNID
ncbi:MAG: sulfatase-like hydrolase/transferase, partial [Bacteroidota bacterium]